jgi:hypothetical protein
MPGGRLFLWEELPRNSSRVDVLEWYIEIANEMNLRLVNITQFPMVVDHRSFTVHTSVCNMWSLYIDRLKAEANKGKKKQVNPILANCLSIIHCLVSNYLNGCDNVESHASRSRRRARINPASLVPNSVFIESSINGSSEEIQSSTSSVKQVPEFKKCRYNKGELIVNLQSVFDGAFSNMKIKTISKQVVDVHQRKIKLWEAWGTHFCRGNQMDVVTSYTPMNPRSCNVTLKDNLTWYYKKTSATMALVWYNLTQGADAQWRKRWFCHLLGSESSVLLWQLLLDK